MSKKGWKVKTVEIERTKSAETKKKVQTKRKTKKTQEEKLAQIQNGRLEDYEFIPSKIGEEVQFEHDGELESCASSIQGDDRVAANYYEAMGLIERMSGKKWRWLGFVKVIGEDNEDISDVDVAVTFPSAEQAYLSLPTLELCQRTHTKQSISGLFKPTTEFVFIECKGQLNPERIEQDLVNKMNGWKAMLDLQWHGVTPEKAQFIVLYNKSMTEKDPLSALKDHELLKKYPDLLIEFVYVDQDSLARFGREVPGKSIALKKDGSDPVLHSIYSLDELKRVASQVLDASVSKMYVKVEEMKIPVETEENFKGLPNNVITVMFIE